MVNLGNDWQNVIGKEFEKDYYKILRGFLINEYENESIFPSMYDIFNALKLTSYSDTKVVILGQDPYYNIGQAHGLAFSVREGVRKPPSLLNIFREMRDDVGTYVPENGNLTYWAKQGVLLLNTILTVREGRPLSHKGRGWEEFTDAVMRALNNRQKPVIFLVWGAPAKKKTALITNKRHYILEAPHPSPLSAHYGFFGCRHFSKTNEILRSLGEKEIDWQIR